MSATILPNKTQDSNEIGDYDNGLETKIIVTGAEGEIKLCYRCHSIISSAPRLADDEYDDYPTHQPSALDLAIAARSGCKICKMFVEKVWWSTGGVMPPTPSHPQHEVSDNFTWYTYGEESRFPKSYNLSIYLSESESYVTPRGEKNYCVLSLVLESIQDESHVPAAVLGGSLASDECFEQILTWYNDCITKHERCRIYKPPASECWFPTRLIDVGETNDPVVKLRMTGETPLEGPYVTLSHRWGEGEMFKLTLSNLERCKQGTPIGDLPQTFADAVQVTRRLQVRYIWIDSLCIIQDSTEDWQAESVQMQRVYACSLLNISAAGPGDSCGSGSLFRQRKPDVDWPMWTTAHDGERRLVYDRNYWRDEVTEVELNRRAWVLQERMVAPRILYFGKSHLFWECHEREACEYFPENVPLLMLSIAGKSLDPAVYRKRSLEQGIQEGNLADHGHQMWGELVKRYMTCGITKTSDRLVAMSGLARQVSTILNDDYIAGLWLSRLVDCLPWRLRKNEGAFRPSPYQAPSWSWASVEGKVGFASMCTKLPLATIEGVSINPVLAGDYFGQIRSGFIKLSGKLLGPISFKTFADDNYATIIFDKEDNSKRIDGIGVYPDLPETNEDNLYCMPMTASLPGGFIVHDCLLLRRLTNEGHDIYERCGVLKFWEETFTMIEDSAEGAVEREKVGWTFIDATIVLI